MPATSPHRDQVTSQVTDTDGAAPASRPLTPESRHASHRLMVLLCCVPILAVAALLMLAGATNTGVLGAVLLYLSMMLAMMAVVPVGRRHHR